MDELEVTGYHCDCDFIENVNCKETNYLSP